MSHLPLLLLIVWSTDEQLILFALEGVFETLDLYYSGSHYMVANIGIARQILALVSAWCSGLPSESSNVWGGAGSWPDKGDDVSSMTAQVAQKMSCIGTPNAVSV